MGSNLRQAACVGAGVWVMDDGFLYIYIYFFGSFLFSPGSACIHTRSANGDWAPLTEETDQCV